MKRGVTLVELLAAIALSALVIALATRIFLAGNRDFLAKALETGRLERLIRLKAEVRRALSLPVARCEGGRLWLEGEAGEKEIGEILKPRFQDLRAWDFRCFEADPGNKTLRECQEGSQVRLVEYRLLLEKHGKRDSLSGSYLK